VDIIRARMKLAGARRPIIILGGGAAGAGAAALKIAEALGAPVITTVAGKGTVSSSPPLCWGSCLPQPAVHKVLQESDCVLAVGTELAETDLWNLSFVLRGNLIRVDIDPAALARPHHAEIAILGDAADCLGRIATGMAPRKTPAPQAPTVELTPLRKMLGTVLIAVREALPEDCTVASDMTQIAYAGNELFPVHHPRNWIHPVGFGTLGFALPAAIGAKFGLGEKPVAALAGDYGLQYTLNELGTAVEYRLPLPILLWNNEALGQIRDNMVDAGIQPNAVTLMNPDFQQLAKAYGARAERPDSLKALGVAIRAALKAEGPTLIEMTPRMAGL
jgi:thiamine pyrophosphate-dependent acetolactate synthase large subunit-like protein